jgi:hypothetical protein
VTGLSLTNQGAIDIAGIGVDFLSAGTVNNSNLIETNQYGVIL